MKLSLIIFSLFYLSFNSYSINIKDGEHRVKVFSNEDGFDQNSINTICTDKNNELWFATPNGLINYDGYNFENFYNSTEESIPSNIIHNLYSDRNGLIWISTNGGLTIYNTNNETFSNINNEGATAYFTEQNKNTYVAYKNTISCYANDSLVETYPIYNSNRAPINSIIAYTDNQLLLSNARGLFINNIDNKETQHIKLDAALDNQYITTLKADGQFIWVGTTQGLFKCVLDKNKLLVVKSYGNTVGSLVQTRLFVLCIFVDHQDNVWIGTAKNGIYRFNKEVDIFYHYPFNETPQSISSSRINCITEDSYGIIWCGTAQGGINKIDLTEKPFYSYSHSKHDNTSIAGNLINSIVEDKAGNIHLSAYNSEICKSTTALRKDKYSKLSFEKTPTLSESLKNLEIISASLDNKGWWWLSGHNNIYLYHQKRDKLIEVTIQAPNETPLDIYNIRVMKQIDDETILLGGDKLVLLKNPWATIEKTKTVKTCPNYIVLGRERQAECLQRDNFGTYWLGTQYGIETFTIEDNEIHINNRINEGNDPNNICLSRIFSILMDKNNNLWIGTFGDGLIKIKLNDQGIVDYIKNYNRKNGLSDEMVYGILEQNDSVIWLSTDMGISKMNTKTETINVYNINDGLTNNNFRRGAFLKSRSGLMLMGGVNGLTIFDPEKIKCNQKTPRAYISELKINNIKEMPYLSGSKEAILSQSITQTKKIVLDYHRRNISLEIIAQQFATPKKNKLEYKLDGIDEDWISVNEGKVLANYTNLPAGEFTFHYRAANGDGIWTEKDQILEITVLAPWHRRWWSISIFLILIISISFFIINYYLKNVKLEQNLKLERLDKQRTHELDQAKLRFFTNISHEFKTPLSLIMAPLEKIIEQSKNEENKKYISIIQGNIDRLQRLIDNLINYRKNESGKVETHYSKTVLADFTYPLLEAFEESMTVKSINFTYNVDSGGEAIVIDEEKTELILFNLLSNAIKFTKQNGTINLDARFERIKGQEVLTFTVSDNGIGISSVNLEKIFDRFYRIEDFKNQSKGFGIGLAFSKSLVDSMNGSIEVFSEPDVKTSFKVILPYKNKPSIKATQKRFHAAHTLPVTQKVSNNTKTLNSALKNLLIIDDEPDFRSFLTHSFEEKYNITCAENGEIGLDNLALHQFDIVICDVMMPGISGFDVCKKIKSNPDTCQIPVILLTALTTSEDEIKGIELGADYYIKKPFSIKQLEVRVSKLIENREKLKSHYSEKSYLPDDSISMSGAERNFLKNVNSIIEQKMSNSSFGVEELAKDAGCSTSHFYRRLKQLTGQIPNAYLRNYRLEKAAELLSSNKDMNAAEVMYHIGIESPSYFSTSFKKAYGSSPSEYKNKKKNSK